MPDLSLPGRNFIGSTRTNGFASATEAFLHLTSRAGSWTAKLFLSPSFSRLMMAILSRPLSYGAAAVLSARVRLTIKSFVGARLRHRVSGAGDQREDNEMKTI